MDDLNIYAAGHLSDDHESVYYEELLERLRLGIMPLIREGSSERNVDTLVPGIVKNNLPTDNMMFCTDDKHVNDIFKEGHISYNVKRSIELGLDPVQAIQMATINAAKHFRLEDKIGSVAPGRFADILLIDDLTTMKPKLVLKSGRIVADENGARPVPEKAYPEKLFDTVHIGADFSAEKFIIHSEGKRTKCRVIDLIKDQIINKEEGRITALAIAIGSAGPTALRAFHTEELLRAWKRPDSEEKWQSLHEEIAIALSEDISPIDDIRATGSYRKTVAANVVLQLVRELWEACEK